jgi:hypothetical protein
MSKCWLCQREGSTHDLAFRRANHAGMFCACDTCYKAIKWHSKHTQKDRCMVCAKEGCKTCEVSKTITSRGGGVSEYSVNWCNSCYPQLESEDEFFDIRACANIESEWEMQRQLALDADDMSCADCGYSDGRLHVHHKIPRSEGGTDDLRNLHTVCPDCHASRHSASACVMCGGIIHDAECDTWLERDGGTAVTFCDECKAYIKKSGTTGERCSVCARMCSDVKVGGRSDGIMLAGSPGAFPACDKCRKVFLFASRGRRESYLDEQLPDSHVDVRHWEGG